MSGHVGTVGYVSWSELLRPPSRAPMTDDERRIVLDRQVQVTSRLVPLFHVAHIIVISIVAWFVIPPSTFRTLWTTAVIGVAVISMRIWLPRSRIPDRRAGRYDMALLIGEANLNGILHGSVILVCHDRLDADGHLLLTAILAGILGAGALALFTTRSVGLSWVTTQTLGMAVAFVLIGGRTHQLLLVVLVLYAAILAFGVLYQSASFIRRCLAEHAAASNIRLVELLLDDDEGGSRDWLWEADDGGVLQRVSARFAEAMGLEPAAMEGAHLADLIELAALADPESDGPVAALRHHLAEDQPFRNLTFAVEVDDDVRHLSLTGKPLELGATDRLGWRGVGSDITDETRQRTEILRLANVDELTGLANRRRFQVDLAERVARRAPEESVQLAILDLDDFKAVNDVRGHPAGDRLLAAVARRLAAVTSPSVTCARLGGDEFALVASGSRPIDWRPYLDALDEPFILDDLPLRVEGSIGHATLPADADTAEALVVAADLALYRAKGAGRLSAFDVDLLATARRRASTRAELIDAIDQHQVTVHFQPQVTASDGQVIGFEALARWQHPTRGLIPPSQFIDMAEQTGLIVALGELVLAEACRAARSWPAPIKVAVNVSAAQLISPDLVHRFATIAEEHRLPLARLEVEVTESVLVDEASVGVLAELRSLGASVSIDDFGTGYSSLAQLSRLPVDQLKIDRLFVDPLDEQDGPARAMVLAILELAEALELTTVAEGVETQTQRDLLRALGCHAIQGFHEARPMPSNQVAAYLRRAGAAPAR